METKSLSNRKSIIIFLAISFIDNVGKRRMLSTSNIATREQSETSRADRQEQRTNKQRVQQQQQQPSHMSTHIL